MDYLSVNYGKRENDSEDEHEDEEEERDQMDDDYQNQEHYQTIPRPIEAIDENPEDGDALQKQRTLEKKRIVRSAKSREQRNSQNKAAKEYDQNSNDSFKITDADTRN